MTGWYSSSWKARSLEYGEGGGFPPPFSYATKQSGGDKTHRPPDTAARLRPTKQPVCFTTERAVCDIQGFSVLPFFVTSFFDFGDKKRPSTFRRLRPVNGLIFGIRFFQTCWRRTTVMLFADGKSTRDSRISGARGCSHLDGTK